MDKTSKTKVTMDYKAPDTLRFDPTNPRFATDGKTPTQPDIQALLEHEPHFAVELVPSFLENGYIDYEPLVVRAEKDHFVVVEGNRRLAAIRHILSKRQEYEAKSDKVKDLDSIPVLVCPEATSAQIQKEQRVYLGVRHLFGFREWPPESKARYLDMQIKSGADLERIAKELNIKRQDIQRYLIPYRLRKEATQLWQQHRDQDFWVLGEGLNRAGIKSYIALDIDSKSMKVRSYEPKKLGFLLKYIYGTTAKGRSDRIVKETRQLSALAKLLQNKRAAAELEKGVSLSQAEVLVGTMDETRHRLQSLVRECRALLSRFKRQTEAAELLNSFRTFSDSVARYLKNVR